MKKKYYSWNDLEKASGYIVGQMYQDSWRPTYLVGITRGGLPLAVMISHLANIPMFTAKVSKRDGNTVQIDPQIHKDVRFGADILIVDDINDSGNTFQIIWDELGLDNIEPGSVRFAAMTENISSEFGHVSYHWDEVNKAENDTWLVYPYEV